MSCDKSPAANEVVSERASPRGSYVRLLTCTHATFGAEVAVVDDWGDVPELSSPRILVRLGGCVTTGLGLFVHTSDIIGVLP